MKLHIPILLSTTLLLGACATLPSSGPTGRQVSKAVDADTGNLGLSLVEVDSAAALPAASAPVVQRLIDRAPPPTDMVGPGDVLGISIYEAGVTLFSSTPLAGAGAAAAGGMETGARVQTLPETRVDDEGNITLPYAGKLHVLGKTPLEIQGDIRRALRGYSQNPQILVTRREVITNSVIVGGEVARPGRLVLNTNQETLSDVVALAGGYRGKASDIVVRVKRRDESADYRLSALLDNPALDVRAFPGDRYTLVYDPMSFSVLGAAGRMEQLPFVTGNMTLAQAISAAGGPNPNLGDPAAIFVFRYVDDPQAPGTRKPVVYHINMMNTGSYFLAQNFAMRDKDVLYFGNARANQPSKLVQLISQLFSPVVAVTSAATVLRN